MSNYVIKGKALGSPRHNSRHCSKASSLSRIHDHTRWDSSGRVIGSTQRSLPDNKQHSQTTDIFVPGGIGTRYPNKRTDPEPRHRPRGHRGSKRRITDENSSRFQSPVVILAQLFNRCGRLMSRQEYRVDFLIHLGFCC